MSTDATSTALNAGPLDAGRQSLRLFDRVDSIALVYVRVVAGIAIFFWVESFLEQDKYQVLFLQPRFLFKYPGLEWVRLWPGNGIYWHFLLAKLASVLLVVGLLTRVAAAFLSFTIAYVLMVECQIYVNHYYLLACLAGLLAFLPADRRCSLDAKLGIANKEPTYWRWQLWLLRFQLGIPYFFGALAKLNGDWLRGQPAESILRYRTNIDGVGPLSEVPGAVEVMAYGGFLYDLLVVPMLLYRRTRWLAIGLSIFFHVSNGLILDIGVFPWFMLAALPVFFPTDLLVRRMRLFLGQPEGGQPEGGQAEGGQPEGDQPVGNQPVGDHGERPAGKAPVRVSLASKLGFAMAISYVLIQILLPTRPWLYGGDSNWNELGHRFAWRMMLRDKRALTHYLLTDKESPDYIYVPSTLVLTPNQAAHADHHPELIRQTAVKLRELARDELGVAQCQVYTLALVSLNGRRPTPMVDPTIDLSRVDRDWRRGGWFNDDPGEFLDPPWSHDPNGWWQELTLPEPFKQLQGRTPADLQAYLEALGKQVRQQQSSKQ